jgi:calcineurin-like phosphoesterase family protein
VSFVKNTINPISIPFDRSKPSKFLLISETQLGMGSNTDKSVTQFITTLQRVIQTEKITHVVHLGDLVKIETSSPLQLLESVLTLLSQLPVPVWLLGGNNDREFLSQLTGGDRRGPVTIVKELAIVVDLPTGNRVWLTHDLGNNFRVRDQFAWSFGFWLKECASDLIKMDDWLLLGHCHGQFLSPESRIGNVGVFSPDSAVWTYTLLSIDDGVEIELRADI